MTVIDSYTAPAERLAAAVYHATGYTLADPVFGFRDNLPCIRCHTVTPTALLADNIDGTDTAHRVCVDCTRWPA